MLSAKDIRLRRFHAPLLESAHPWLPRLLDAYAFMDAALAQDLQRKREEAPACGARCSACCSQPVPLTSVEAMGIRIYRGNESSPAGDDRAKDLWQCPFLVEERCGVYPVRPFACRRLIVYNTRCVLGEDPTKTRPRDVLRPSQNALMHALRMLAPLYVELGLLPEGVEAGMDFFKTQTLLIQQIADTPDVLNRAVVPSGSIVGGGQRR